MVLVVGSTGLMGSEIVARARRAGLPVRAMARPTSSPERIDAIRASGAEVVWGDLKDAASLASACEGVEAVISTASSTLSRQPGDSIASVDHDGQIALVNAARQAGVRHFTFFGVDSRYGASPLIEAKMALADAVRESGMSWTNLEGTPFMEVWLTPALGFNYAKRTAVVFGSGEQLVSWVSMCDLAEAAVNAHRVAAAANRAFDACGPEALSPNEVIRRFETMMGEPFEVQRVPEEALVGQYAAAADPLAKTFAGLQLACARGLAMDPGPFAETFGLTLTTIDQYVLDLAGRPH